MILTSGTISELKAVQIAARSIVQVVYHARFEPVDQTNTVAHVNSTSFDVSLFDMWAPLPHGARIIVLKKVILLDLPAMAAAIEQEGIKHHYTLESRCDDMPSCVREVESMLHRRRGS